MIQSAHAHVCFEKPLVENGVILMSLGLLCAKFGRAEPEKRPGRLDVCRG